MPAVTVTSSTLTALWSGATASGDKADPSLLQISPSSIRLLACKQSFDGQALVVRLQEATGQATPASLKLVGMTAPATLAFKPYEIKTLRLERNGVCLAVNPVNEK